MKITVLIENQKDEKEEALCGLTAEHGLSLFVEYRDRKYLLDAGSTDAFLENARLLGVNLRETDACLLSHGHYDHSGGFAAFYRRMRRVCTEEAASGGPGVPEEKLRKLYGSEMVAGGLGTFEGRLPRLYASEAVAGEYLSGSGGLHYIGLPRDLLAQMGEFYVPVTRAAELDKGLWAVPHTTQGLEKIGEAKKLYKMCDEVCVPDDFSHEVSYVFRTDAGLVVINSCSHGGILNILDEVAEVFPGETVCAFLGGLHMKGTRDGQEICTFTEEEIASLCEGLRRHGIRRVYTGHCTGIPGYELLKRYLGERLFPLRTGMEIVLG